MANSVWPEYLASSKAFETILELAIPDVASLRPGQAVRATIRLEEIPDALAVPRGAIFDVDGRRVVYRSKDSGFEAVDVQVGSTSLGRAVVESGLAAGDRIALRDPALLASVFVPTGEQPEEPPR